MAASDAKPVPQKNVAYRVTFPILDADGDLVTGATGLDSEVSKDGGTFADCTNEATEIATSSGVYYLDLTSTEMNADTVAVIVKTSSSGAKTTVLVMYPEEAGDIRVNVTAYGGTAGTFSGGRPEVNTSHIAGSAVSTSTAQIGVNVVNAGGTAWGSGAITAASIASDAITAAKIANGAIDAATFAADVDAEILSYLVDDATRIDASALNTATGTSIPAILADTGTDGVVVAASSKTGYSLTATTGLGNQTADITGSLSGSVGSVTGNVGGNVTGSVGSLATQAKADVLAEAQSALQSYNLDHLLAVALPTEFNTIVDVNSVIGYLAHNNLGTGTGTAEGGYNRTTDSLESISLSLAALEAGTAPTAAEVADAVWDEARAGHVAGGSFGEYTNANVTHYGGSAGTATSGIPSVNVSQFGGSNGTFAAGRPEVNMTHIAGSAVNTNSAQLGVNLVNIAGSIVNTNSAQIGVNLVNIAGSLVSTSSAQIGVNVVQVSGDGTAADNLETAFDGGVYNVGGGGVVADSVTGAVGSVTGNVGGNVAGSVGSVTGNVGGNVTGSVGSLATQAKADVQAEAEEALTTYRLHTLIHTAITGEFHTAVHVDSVIGYLAHNNVGTGTGTVEGGYNRTTDSLESIALAVALVDAGTAPTAVEVADAVRTELTTELGRIDVATSTRLASSSYTAPLDAAGTRTAVGLASANLDTQLDALPTAAENAAAVLAAGDVDGYTLEQTLKLCLAALAGKLSGAATTTITIRAADDSKDRITATVDQDGNRTALTLDAAG